MTRLENILVVGGAIFLISQTFLLYLLSVSEQNIPALLSTNFLALLGRRRTSSAGENQAHDHVLGPQHVTDDHQNHQQNSKSKTEDAAVERRLKLGGSNLVDERVTSSSPHQHWLDTVVAAQYPHMLSTVLDYRASIDQSTLPKLIYPSEWHNDPTLSPIIRTGSRRNSAGLLHVQWTTPGTTTTRHSGFEDQPLSLAEGGNTVQGSWPDLLTDLSFVPVLKNAHTHLLNTVADLKQRLDANVDYVPKVFGRVKGIHKSNEVRIQEILLDAVQKQKSGTIPGGHVVFAVVRDPVDRFLSATCQELSLNSKKVLQRGCDVIHSNKPYNGIHILDCMLNRIKSERTLLYHQTHQVKQIELATAGAPGVAISLIPQESAIEQLIAELGGRNRKVRSRTETEDYKKQEVTEKFCQLKVENLTESQIFTICWIYAADVHLLRNIAEVMPVTLCERFANLENWPAFELKNNTASLVKKSGTIHDTIKS
jgi:hypothetical protein